MLLTRSLQCAGGGIVAAKKADATPCKWISGPDAFKEFATHTGKTQSAGHIKPLHWYIACRLVLEGGFRPDDITPRPPFEVQEVKGKKGRISYFLKYNEKMAGAGEQIVLGGLKTKNVDVVVNRKTIGPVLAISCKGVTKAFRNLTNRMEETIGECTNLHITYPAMVIGYFAILRANRTVQDVIDARKLDDGEEHDEEGNASVEDSSQQSDLTQPASDVLKSNDIAIFDDDRTADGIVRFHAALREMTSRQGIRDEISRYEAMTLVLIEPKGAVAGNVVPAFPPADSPLLLKSFFSTLYQRYEERFVYGAPLLADRGLTTRLQWDPLSEVFAREARLSKDWPPLDFSPRLASPEIP
jgi:hypothetical protein